MLGHLASRNGERHCEEQEWKRKQLLLAPGSQRPLDPQKITGSSNRALCKPARCVVVMLSALRSEQAAFPPREDLAYLLLLGSCCPPLLLLGDGEGDQMQPNHQICLRLWILVLFECWVSVWPIAEGIKQQIWIESLALPPPGPQ